MKICFSGNDRYLTTSMLIRYPESSRRVFDYLAKKHIQHSKPVRVRIAGASDRSEAIGFAIQVADKYRRSVGNKGSSKPYLDYASQLVKIEGLEKEPDIVRNQAKGLFWFCPPDLKHANDYGVRNIVDENIVPATREDLNRLGFKDGKKLNHPSFNPVNVVRTMFKHFEKREPSKLELMARLEEFLNGEPLAKFKRPHILSPELHRAAGDHRLGCIFEDAKQRAQRGEEKEPEIVLFRNVAQHISSRLEQIPSFVSFIRNTAANLAPGSSLVIGDFDCRTNMVGPKVPTRMDQLLLSSGLKPAKEGPQMDPVLHLNAIRSASPIPQVTDLVWEKQ